MLTEKEIIIFETFKNYINENGYVPSIREIGEIVGLKSPATVKVLEEKEYIERKENSPRALRVIRPGTYSWSFFVFMGLNSSNYH